MREEEAGAREGCTSESWGAERATAPSPLPTALTDFDVTYQVGRAQLLSALGSPGDQRTSVTTGRNDWAETSGGGVRRGVAERSDARAPREEKEKTKPR